MIKFFCDLCEGEITLASNTQPTQVNFFLKERAGQGVVFQSSKILCPGCIHSMAEWAASRKK